MQTDAPHDIALANQRFMSAFLTNDRELFGARYTEDAQIMLPALPILQGREGAKLFFDSLKGRGIHELRLSTHELEQINGTAWERGSSEALSADGSTLGRSKYIVIWRLAAEGWLLHRDILNAI